MNAADRSSIDPSFFKVRLLSLAPDRPLPCDVYVVVNEKATLLRKKGDQFKRERLSELARLGVRFVLVPQEQRLQHSQDIDSLLQEPNTPLYVKARVMKEAALAQLDALYTAPTLSPVIADTQRMVESLVGFLVGSVGAVEALTRLSTSDPFTFQHSINVAAYAVALAKAIAPNDTKFLSTAALAGLVHDIGKRNVEPDVRDAQSAYSAQDVLRLREHPLVGEEMLSPFSLISPDVRRAVGQHHESYDGTGYPRGLHGLQISKLARLIAIADVYDALTIERSGHAGLLPDEALESMVAMVGRFDPELFRSLQRKHAAPKPGRPLAAGFDPCHPQAPQFA